MNPSQVLPLESISQNTHKVNKRTLLLVEDDENLGFVVKDYLEHNNYTVHWVKDGQAGLKMALESTFDIAVFDIMLPKLGGFELAEEVIESKPELPFLFLTAKSMINDKVKGLQLGRDYLTKPFEFEELKLRLENILKAPKLQFNKLEETEFTIGKYHFDSINQYLSFGNKTQKLTKKEVDLLILLCLHKNDVLSRTQALNSIWGNDDYFNGRSMDVFISRLRKYLRMDENIQILNIHGIGFKLAVKS